MDLIMAVAKSTATSGADVSPAVRHGGVAGSDFAALMNSKRSADTLANSPLIQAVRGMSDSHRNMLATKTPPPSFDIGEIVTSKPLPAGFDSGDVITMAFGLG
ncbi:MAG: hypothetical protein HEQ39_01595 [Rhizobacter sp.]